MGRGEVDRPRRDKPGPGLQSLQSDLGRCPRPQRHCLGLLPHAAREGRPPSGEHTL